MRLASKQLSAGLRLANKHGRALIRELRAQPAARQAPEGAEDKARRLGYVEHGEFKYRIAYDSDVIPARVINTISRGAYERFEARRSSGLVENGDRIIELGAGLGFLSALLMSTKRVDSYHAVEADPRLPKMIRRTHELNHVEGPLTIHNCVATCDPELLAAGNVEFFVGEKFCASSLLGVNSTLKHTVQVPTRSLPEMISEYRANVIICDIEGAEAGVFNGTQLGGVEKILMETHPHRLGLSGIRTLFHNLDAQEFVYDGNHSSGNVCAFRRLSTE